MSLVITQRPSITSPIISRWNAVGNPILYKFTRKDFVFNQVNNNAGNIQLQFNGVNISASFSVNDVVWVESDNGVYSAQGTVTASTYSAPDTFVTINIPYTSAAPGGYINNNTTRLNYKASIGVYAPTLIGTLKLSPDKKGVIIADVSRTLWAVMSPDININIETDEQFLDETNVYKGFHIRYTEVWIGSANSETSDVANEYFCNYGSRQIKSNNAGNMYEYLCRPGVSIFSDSTFLTDWTNQGIGISWVLPDPNDLYVLLNEQTSKRARRPMSALSGARLQVLVHSKVQDFTVASFRLKAYFSNGQEIDFGTLSNTSFQDNIRDIVLTSEVTYIEFEGDTTDFGICAINIAYIIVDEIGNGRFLTKLNEYVYWEGFPCLVSAIIGNIVNRTELFVQGGPVFTYVDDLDDQQVLYNLKGMVEATTINYDFTIYLKDETNLADISEEKTVIYRIPCDNAIMLIGRNTLGGALSWLFDYSQEYTFTYEDGRKAKRLILFAENLTLNQWEALQDFVTLGEVYRDNIVEFTSSTIKTKSRIGSQVYAVDQSGNKVGVIVIPSSNTTRTRQSKHNFTIEIEYPEIFTT